MPPTKSSISAPLAVPSDWLATNLGPLSPTSLASFTDQVSFICNSPSQAWFGLS